MAAFDEDVFEYFDRNGDLNRLVTSSRDDEAVRKSSIMEGKQCTTGCRQNVSRYFTFSDALIALTEFIFDDEAIQTTSLLAEGVHKLTVSPRFHCWRALYHGMMA